MKKSLFSLVLTLVMVVVCSVFAGATSITQYDAQFSVGSDGKTSVTTQIKLSLDGSYTQLIFPIGSGTKGEIAGQNAKTIAIAEGNALSLTSELGYTGDVSFTIYYQVPTAVDNVGTGQVLTLELLPPGYDFSIDQLNFSVALPLTYDTELPEDYALVPVYVGGYYDTIVDNYFDLNQTNSGFSGSSLEPLQDHDTLVVTLDYPAKTYDYYSLAGLPGWMTICLMLLFYLMFIFYWYTNLYTPPVLATPQNRPPKGVGAGDLPMFLFRKQPNLPLEVCHWASKGLLIIHRQGREIALEQVSNMEGRTPKPKVGAFDQLFKHDNICTVNSLVFCKVLGKYPSILRKYWESQTIVLASGGPEFLRQCATAGCVVAMVGSGSLGLAEGNFRWLGLVFCAILGLILPLFIWNFYRNLVLKRYQRVMVAGVALCLFIGAGQLWGGTLSLALAAFLLILSDIAMFRGRKPSPKGQQLNAQAKGFALHLSRVSSQKMEQLFMENDQIYFELLPYAQAAGMGKQLTELLKRVELPPCPWLNIGGKSPKNTKEFYAQFLKILSAMHNANTGVRSRRR